MTVRFSAIGRLVAENAARVWGSLVTVKFHRLDVRFEQK
jgi:hypothetical protein